MKKKLILIPLLVLALIVSVGVSAVANPGSVATLASVGAGTAEWSTEEVKVGSHSAKLYVEDGSADWAEVSIPVDIALKDIYQLKFWEYIKSYASSGAGINVILGVDLDNDGVFESDLPAWHQGATSHTLAVLNNDAFIEMDAHFWGGSNPSPTGSWLDRNALTEGYWWAPDTSGTGFCSYWGNFAGLLAFLNGKGNDSIVPDTNARVKCVKLLIGGSGSWMDETAFVDGVTINGILYKLEPPPPREDPDRFNVFVRLGYDSTHYYPDNTLRGSIEAAGEYSDTQYMLGIPEGCEITGAAGRVSWLWLPGIDGDTLSFVGGRGNVEFGKPCTLYIAEGGKIYQDQWTGEWLGDGEWVKVGSFRSIVDGEAHLN